MSRGELFDVGLQPERTELAWRRTALAIATGALVSMRLLPAAFEGAVWVLPGLTGVAFSIWLWLGARARYRRFTAAAWEGEVSRGPGAVQLCALSTFGVACGLLSLVVTAHSLVSG